LKDWNLSLEKKSVSNKCFCWDIDGTVVSPSLESQFISFVRTRRLVSNWQLAGRFAALALSNPRLPWHGLKLAYLRGESVSDVDQWIEEWWPSALASIKPGAQKALLSLRDAGVQQVLLSGTLQALGGRLALEWGISDVIAAQPEFSKDRYTGSLVEPHPHGRFKVTYAERWLRERNIDWSDVIALADHEGDQFLLERAGVAVAVNPRAELATMARERGWQVAVDADLPDLVTKLL
jgi:phosphoserine phosphatase